MKKAKIIIAPIIAFLLVFINIRCDEDKFIPDSTEREHFFIGGTDSEPLSCKKISFDDSESGSVNFSELRNVATRGGYLWKVTENRSNRSVEMSVQGTQGVVKSWLVVQVDFDNAGAFSFTSRDGYNNGSPLKVMLASNYSKEKQVTEIEWRDITNEFTLASNAPIDAMSNVSTPSGSWDLSNVSGQGAVAFVYEGQVDGVTTVMQIDNITITDSTNPECVSAGGDCVVGELPVSSLPLNYDFEEENSLFFVVTEEGLRKWSIFEEDGNKFLMTSSFESGESNKTWLLSPVIDFDLYLNETLNFDSRDGYFNGQPLKVMYSSDYDGSACPSDFSWEEIGATIASGSTNGFAEDMTNSGIIDLSALTGSGHIAFVYEGDATGVTTDMQIDNILIDGSTCVNNGVDETMLVNPGFEDWCAEDQPKGWGTVDEGVDVSQDKQIVYEGNSSMKVVIADHDKQDIQQKIPVEEGKYYKVSFWVHNTDEQVSARLVTPGWPSVYADRTVTGQWQKVEYIYEATSTGTIGVGMRFYKSSTGWTGPSSTLYIDSFNVEEVQKPSISALVNGSFETWIGNNLEAWQMTSGADMTVEEEIAIVSEGEKSIKVTTGATNKLDIFQEIELEVGKTYTWSVDVYLTDDQVNVRMVPGIIWGAYSDGSLVNQWQTVTNTVTVEAGGSGQGYYEYFEANGKLTRFRFYFSGGSTPNPASVIYVDNFRIVEHE